jgi:GTPase SAR1 family protein
VAFVGQSGAGKSTLAAALVRRGHQIIGDDQCFLQLGSNKDVKVWPGMSRIRLWEDATLALGFDCQGLEPEIHGYNKYLISTYPPRNPLRYRLLRGVFQLHRVPGGDTEVIRLHGADAIEVLMQNIYPSALAAYLGYQPFVFAVCVAVARDVPVFRLSRPRDFSALNRGIELLENHLQNLSS